MSSRNSPRLQEKGKFPAGRKILLVANTDWYLFNFRLSLAQFLRNSGWQVVLISPAGQYGDRLIKHGFRHRTFPLNRRSLQPFAELRSLARLLKIYRSEMPDLVHHFTLKPVLYGTIAARFLGSLPVVNAVTGLGTLFLDDSASIRAVRPIVKAAYRAAVSSPHVKLIFENPADMGFYLQEGLAANGQVTLIPSAGVDLERFTPSEPEERSPVKVLQVGRLLRDKGVYEFTQASGILSRRGVDVRMILVGDPDPGNPTSVPVGTVENWKAQGLIEWWGHRVDMPSVYAHSDIIVLASYGEGVPSALLEAAASARPIIATDVPGCREIVDPGDNGLLVPVQDSVALADAIEDLAGDPQRRIEMGMAGRRKVEQEFDQRRIIRQTVSVYRDALGLDAS